MHTEERGVQTYFPKVVKSFRTVAAQTDNNIAINILNNKKVHPEDIYKHWIIIMEDNNFSMGPSTCKSPLANMFIDVATKRIAAGINKLPVAASLIFGCDCHTLE